MKCAIFDADVIMYVVCYNKDKTIQKSLEQCYLDVDDFINNIIGFTKADSYIFYLTIGRNFRYKFNPDYKGNRKNLVKPQYFDEVKQYLIDKYKAISHPDLEADDLCVITKKQLEGSFIVTPDKDILGLEGEHFNPKAFKYITTSLDEEYINFWRSMVTGDTVDNIKGIEGSGVAFFTSLQKKCHPMTAWATTILSEAVFKAYVDKYGEEKGVELFYMNYKCLKIKDVYEGFEIPTPVSVKYERKKRTKAVSEVKENEI